MLKTKPKNQMEKFLMSNEGFVKFLLQAFQQKRQKGGPMKHIKRITKFHQNCFQNSPDVYAHIL